MGAGLPESSLPDLIAGLATQATDALSGIPGISPNIIGVSVTALKSAYLDSLRYIWIVSTVLAAVGLVGMFLPVHWIIGLVTNICRTVSFFFLDEKKDFNPRIDAPAESEEALYGTTKHVMSDVPN